MDRRDFIKGAAVTIAATAFPGAPAYVLEPAEIKVAASAARVTHITLPSALVGQSFTIKNTGDQPITIGTSPSDTILAPGEQMTVPESIVEYSYA
jgi:anaerobic selenocysteine-containing dehydrogenase